MQTTNTRSENVSTIVSHPDFLRWLDDWKTLNDTVDGGASTVKYMGQKYLPATSGQVAAWNKAMPGVQREWINQWQYVDDSSCGTSSCVGQGAYAYYLYMFRSVFYEYPAETVRQMVGRLINEDPSEVNFPGELGQLVDLATSDGQTLNSLIEAIYTEQCKYSRCGVLADFPESLVSGKPPYLTIYGALRVLNWSVSRNEEGKEVLDWVVLDESKDEANGINWEYRTVIRVCALDENGDYFTQAYDITEISDDQGKIDDLQMLEPGEDAVYPMYKGKTSKKIPFVFINATNISATPELPLLKNVTEMSLAIYRGEADYRQALFVQGQSTPSFSGVSPDEAKNFLLGANGGVASQNENFKASYMEVSGNGLREMRESQEALHNKAVSEGMKLVDAGANESGEALKVRTESQTVSLEQIASTCEQGLKYLMEVVAEWGGIDGDVELSLNREFGTSMMTPKELQELVGAYNAGAPITRKDMHTLAKKGGMAESEWSEVENDMDMSGRNDLNV